MTDEVKPLTHKQKVFVDEYVKCWNASEAARLAGYSERSAREIGRKLLTNVDIKAYIDARLGEIHMSADEALALQTQIAHADMGVFYKVVEEWMFNPLPSYEILGEKEVIDEEAVPPRKRVSYLVRHVVLDMDKVIDPRYSHLIQEFSDSRRSGLKIKTYDKQAAIRDVLKIAGKFKEQVDITSGGKPIEPKVNDERFDRAISTLADAIRESISGSGAKQDGEVGAAE